MAGGETRGLGGYSRAGWGYRLRPQMATARERWAELPPMGTSEPKPSSRATVWGEEPVVGGGPGPIAGGASHSPREGRYTVVSTNCSRSSSFLNLPVAVRGISSTNSKRSGSCHLAKSRRGARAALPGLASLPFAEHDDGQRSLPPLLVGDGDHSGLGHA